VVHIAGCHPNQKRKKQNADQETHLGVPLLYVRRLDLKTHRTYLAASRGSVHPLPCYAYNKANESEIPEPNPYELPVWHAVEISNARPNATRQSQHHCQCKYF